MERESESEEHTAGRRRGPVHRAEVGASVEVQRVGGLPRGAKPGLGLRTELQLALRAVLRVQGRCGDKAVRDGSKEWSGVERKGERRGEKKGGRKRRGMDKTREEGIN